MFGQQIWVALPKALEEVDPSFSNHAEQTLPGPEADGASLTVIAGDVFSQRSPVPVFSDLSYEHRCWAQVRQPIAGARGAYRTRHVRRLW